MIKHIYRNLFRQSRRSQLPRLMPALRREFDPRAIDDEELGIAMMTGRFRDIEQCRRTFAAYNVTTALDLMSRLPPPRKPSWRRRLLWWLQILEGGYKRDPWRAEYERLTRR
jgi:hypothetical protein